MARTQVPKKKAAGRPGGGTEGEQDAPARAFFDGDHDKDDSLRVGEQVESFARLITGRDVRLPLSIGLFGNWGVGKTHFMELLKEAVERIGKEQRIDDEKSVYVRRSAQIWFNAWHYVDTSLWASLALRIFDGIAEEYAGNRLANQYEAVRSEIRTALESSKRRKQEATEVGRRLTEERRKAKEELGELRVAREERKNDYDLSRFTRILSKKVDGKSIQDSVVKNAKVEAARLGLNPVIDSVGDVEDLAKQFEELQRGARGLLAGFSARFADGKTTLTTLAWVSLVIGVAWGIDAGTDWLENYKEMFRGAISGLVPPLLTISAVVGPALRWLGKNANAASNGIQMLSKFKRLLLEQEETPVEKDARKKIAAYDAQIEATEKQLEEAELGIREAQRTLQRINAGGLVYDFVEGRLSDSRYTKELGVISTIRQDLEELAVLLKDWNDHHVEKFESLPGDAEPDALGRPPIERIVLYIDDLDRCHPDKVVDVLQAVHLLLAFDLFVVVVAVDPRWLERSLYRKYLPERMGSENGPTGGVGDRSADFSPQNYLEKIFQVPFSLAKMTETGYRNLVGRLALPRDKRSLTPAPKRLAASGRANGNHLLPLQPFEKTFIEGLYPFVGTPRLAKRLVNIYRLLRVRAGSEDFDFDAFIERNGQYGAALILLALHLGNARFGSRLVRLLGSGTPEGTWSEFFAAISPTLDEKERPRWAKEFTYEEDDVRAYSELKDALEHLEAHLAEEALQIPEDLEAYKTWALEVGRYSFHWYLV